MPLDNESKATVLSELKTTLEGFAKAFEAYKDTNDERFKQIEKNGTTDPITEDKDDRIQKFMDDRETEKKALEEKLAKMEAFMGRPDFGAQDDAMYQPDDGDKFSDDKQIEVFERYLKFDDPRDKALLDKFAAQVGVSADGGAAVPQILDRTLTELVTDNSVMRNLARMVPVSSPDYKRLVNMQGSTAGWVGETDTRPTTDTPKLAEITPVWGEIYAFPKATQQSLEDPFFSVENWIASDVAREMAEEEDTAFISGDGVNKPRGLLDFASTAVATADSTRAFGTMQKLATGAAGDFAATDGQDIFYDVEAELHPRFRRNAKFLMTRRTLSKIRKFKIADGQKLWQPGLTTGAPSKIIGYEYVEDEYMPELGAGSLSIAFGDFAEAYWVMTRPNTTVAFRDIYTDKPYIGFYFRSRVGSLLNQSQAMKFIEFGV